MISLNKHEIIYDLYKISPKILLTWILHFWGFLKVF